MARKKKVIHWSKLPRAKLVSMVKRLQADKTKLQLQLAQARETKLLNKSLRPLVEGCLADGATIWLRDVDGTGSLHPCAKGDDGAIPYARVFATQDEVWERANRDQAGVVTGRLPYVVKDNSTLDEMLEHGVVHITQDGHAIDMNAEYTAEQVKEVTGRFPWEKE